MAITKKSDRQEVISVIQDFTHSDLPTLVGAAAATTTEAIQLPEKAIIVGGELVITTPWNTEGVKATGTFTSTDQPADTNTVTIGSTVYTFKTSLSTEPTVAYEVLIGANEAATLVNLKKAINAEAGIGTNYSTGTEVHPTVTATASDAHTVSLEAKTGGTAGNSIATTTTHANGSFGDNNLTGGVSGGDTIAVKIGSETYRTAADATAVGAFALVPTGTKLAAQDTVDLIHDVADTSITTASAGAGYLIVNYIVDGRAAFSQG
jgi:hypothetical protein